jgi:hypothetical protein
MTRHPDMPPKPPRVPPWLYSWSALINYGVALMVVAVDGLVVVVVLQDGARNDLTLAFLAIGMTLAVLSVWRTLHTVLSTYNEWQDLRREWDRINEMINNEREGGQ